MTVQHKVTCYKKQHGRPESVGQSFLPMVELEMVREKAQNEKPSQCRSPGEGRGLPPWIEAVVLPEWSPAFVSQAGRGVWGHLPRC